MNLFGNKEEVIEAVVLETQKFKVIKDTVDEENFLLVILECNKDLHAVDIQKSFIEFLRRNKLIQKLRYAGLITAANPIAGKRVPEIFEDVSETIDKKQLLILEFKIETLDDPRMIVMRKLQRNSYVDSTRTFFGVNFGKEEKALDVGMSKLDGGLQILERIAGIFSKFFHGK